MTQRTWWQRPQLHTDEEAGQERKVSWLELFFDLVFVVVISQLAHHLASHISLAGAAGFVLLFIPVWWVWIGGTLYNERFETSDVSNRLFVFLQMLPVAALAVFARAGLEDGSIGFALSYVAARILLIFLWLRGSWHVPPFRPVSNRYAAGFTLSVLLFITSVFVPPPLRFLLWGLGLTIDLVTPMFTLKIQARLPRFSTSRLPERFGLFTIIVLGESIVGVVQGMAERPVLSGMTAVAGVLGMSLAFGLWWLYFDYIARRYPKRGVWWTLSWAYLHLPLVMAIAAAGAGVLNVIAGEDPALPANVRWLLVCAVAVALATMALIEITLQPAQDEPADPRLSPTLKLVGSVLALALGFWGSGLGSLPLLGGLITLIAIQIVYAAYVWFRQPLAHST